MNNVTLLISPHFVERLYKRGKIRIEDILSSKMTMLTIENEPYCILPFNNLYALLEKKGNFLHAITVLPATARYIKGKNQTYKIADFSKIVSVSIVGYRYTNGGNL